MHHIISDGWSSSTFYAEEMGQFYAAALRGQDPLSTGETASIQYRDFARVAEDRSRLPSISGSLNTGPSSLKDSSPAELLVDKP